MADAAFSPTATVSSHMRVIARFRPPPALAQPSASPQASPSASPQASPCASPRNSFSGGTKIPAWNTSNGSTMPVGLPPAAVAPSPSHARRRSAIPRGSTSSPRLSRSASPHIGVAPISLDVPASADSAATSVVDTSLVQFDADGRTVTLQSTSILSPHARKPSIPVLMAHAASSSSALIRQRSNGCHLLLLRFLLRGSLYSDV